MRQRNNELAKGGVQFVPPLWVETAGGKQRMGEIKITRIMFHFSETLLPLHCGKETKI